MVYIRSDKQVDLVMKSGDKSRSRFFKHFVALSWNICVRKNGEEFLFDQTLKKDKILMIWPSKQFAQLYYKNQADKIKQLKDDDIDNFFRYCSHNSDFKVKVFPGANKTGLLMELGEFIWFIREELEYMADQEKKGNIIDADLETRVRFFKHDVAENGKIWFSEENACFMVTRFENGRLGVPVWPTKKTAMNALKNSPMFRKSLVSIDIEDFWEVLKELKNRDIDVFVFPNSQNDGASFSADSFRDYMEDELSFQKDLKNWHMGMISDL